MDMQTHNREFVDWFRSASPYIHVHRGQTCVICFGAPVEADTAFAKLIHDIALLSALGVRIIAVFSTRAQIDARLREVNLPLRIYHGLRVTDSEVLRHAVQSAGELRAQIEALLSMGVVNSPMAGARVRVASGNFVAARPIGVRDGVDYAHTGEVRRVDTVAIESRLDAGEVVLVPPLGYSPTGEIFNLYATDAAVAIASALKANKLVLMLDAGGIVDAKGKIIRQLTQAEAEQMVAGGSGDGTTHAEVSASLRHGINACRGGVKRVHFISRRIDGALLLELFSRDGIGTLVSASSFDEVRTARIDDIGGILLLIEPLEQQGVLVRRSRELLELEIGHFTVAVRDGTIIACAALYIYESEAVAELACLAVHPEYRNEGRGEAMLNRLCRQSVSAGVTHLFVLTTQTAHWFVEHGFAGDSAENLPVARKKLYNYQRNAKVFVKKLAP